jgi:hypothetical protein
MPFGLRNAGATYQRCMHDQIDKNVQVYVDNVVIKTKERKTLIDDLRETFANLRRFRMKLNSAKCTFGVPAGKLLGFQPGYRGKSWQDLCHRKNEAADKSEGSVEVHWMPCVPESFHKPAWRKSSAVISTNEEVRHICLDNASRYSFQGVEADAVNSTGVGIPNAEGADVALYSCDQQGCQCSGGSGARGRRQNRVAASILSK